MVASRWVAIVAVMAFATGCVASPAVPQAAPLPPPAPPPPSAALRAGDVPVIVRWQQFCEQASNVEQASWLASSRGGDGWELVSMYGGVLCFKRPSTVEPAHAVPTLVVPPEAPPEMLGARTPTPTPTLPATSTVPRIIDPGF